jgi:cell division protein FtsZ
MNWTTSGHSSAAPSNFLPVTPSGVHRPVLKVIGLGGGGCNAIERMMALEMGGVEFIAANTDIQALKTNPAPTRILLGPEVAGGFGAGGNPEKGRQAAEESRVELAQAMAGADMVFLTAGMGGGTGTGSIAVAAEVARAQGAVTIAIVTTPFGFEMGRRQKNASEGLTRLRRHTHTLVTIPNDRLLYVAPRNLSMQLAFHLADDVLRQAVQGITELVTETGLINVDFAHIRRLILLGGGALMSMGQAEGENKAHQALEQALHHPLLDSVDLSNAAGVIANFTGGQDLSLFEVQSALSSLQARTGDQTEIIFGVMNDERMDGRAQVILMITGLGSTSLEEAVSSLKPAAAAPAPQPRSTAPVEQYVPVQRTPDRESPAARPPTRQADFQAANPQAPAVQDPKSFFRPTASLSTTNLDLPAFLRARVNDNLRGR